MESPTSELEESSGSIDKSLELKGEGSMEAAEDSRPPQDQEEATSPQQLGDLVSSRELFQVCQYLRNTQPDDVYMP